MMQRAQPSKATPVADIFISYTASDRDWAFWIAKELESLGHTPHEPTCLCRAQTADYGYRRYLSKGSMNSISMAEEGVICEPVSASNFPANRKKTGKIAESAPPYVVPL
jgi:hypothetical protein